MRVRTVGDHVELHVIDAGPGLTDEERQPRLRPVLAGHVRRVRWLRTRPRDRRPARRRVRWRRDAAAGRRHRCRRARALRRGTGDRPIASRGREPCDRRTRSPRSGRGARGGRGSHRDRTAAHVGRGFARDLVVRCHHGHGRGARLRASSRSGLVRRFERPVDGVRAVASGRTRGCARPAGARAARTDRRARRRVRDGPHRRRDDPAAHPARRRVRRRASAAGGAVRRRSRRASTDVPVTDAAAAAAPGRASSRLDAVPGPARPVRRTAPDASSSGCGGSSARIPPAPVRADARARRLPERQLHRRRRKASARCSTGSSPTSATRSRTSDGCA